MTTERLTFEAASLDDTARLGSALAEALPSGGILALEGTLGAGKTRLVQCLAEALGIDPRDVTSPTFVLLQDYRGRQTIYHLDAYRLRDEDELAELGVDELYESGAIVCVEWADRVASSMPHERLQIQIEVTGPDSRTFQLIAHGDKYAAVLKQLEARLKE